jgi:curved DNA-binding protein CbpA
MATAFKYRPKFVDIRVNKPAPDDAPRAPKERACDQIGCACAGLHRAPKSRERANEYWWFCAAHAAEYNRRWNYFDGMSAGEYAAFAREAEIGHRPTWTFQASRLDREAAVHRKFNAFRAERGPGGEPNRPAPRRPRTSRLAMLALEALGLKDDASPSMIRAKYADLVKRYHPDSNGGDRSYEQLLIKVVRAYQTLKSAGMT